MQKRALRQGSDVICLGNTARKLFSAGHSDPHLLPNPCALMQEGIWYQKVSENLPAKAGTVYMPRVALIPGRQGSRYVETHVNMNTHIPACL